MELLTVVINFTGQANGVALNQLQGLATDAAGDLYVANTYDNQVGTAGVQSGAVMGLLFFAGVYSAPRDIAVQ